MGSARRGRLAAITAFLKTIPGLLTAFGTLLAAVTGLITVLAQVGVIQVRSPIVRPTTTVTASTTAAIPAVAAATTGTDNGTTDTTQGVAQANSSGYVTVYLDQLQGLNDTPAPGSREIGGTNYPHAMHTDLNGCASSDSHSYEYDLGRHYRKFITAIGVDDAAADSSTQVQFEVFIDGVRKSSVVKGIGNATQQQFDVTGALRLKMIATMVHPTHVGCVFLADWGDPQLQGLPSEVPPSTAS